MSCEKLENHIQKKIMGTVDVSDADMMSKILAESSNTDPDHGWHRQVVETARGSEPIDQEWLREMTQLLAKLEKFEVEIHQRHDRKWPFQHVRNATGCTSVLVVCLTTPTHSFGPTTSPKIRPRWRWVFLKPHGQNGRRFL
ncbi:MAG: hypothetical protein R2788_01305 [Saprospiraceae bacterium]